MVENNKNLSLCRIGDQPLFEVEDGGWATRGYYQLKELSSCFKGGVVRYAAFGRILDRLPETGDLYKIPLECVQSFEVLGVKVEGQGLFNYLKALPDLVRESKKVSLEYDVKWVMLPSLAGLIQLLVCCRKRRGVYVAQLVGEWQGAITNNNPLSSLLITFLDRLTNFAIKRADLVVFVSNAIKEKYGSGLKKPVLIANESRISNAMIRELDRSEIHDPFRILFVGRLVEGKGLQYLISALAEFKGTTNFELWVVGDGPYKETLEKMAQEYGFAEDIRWFGWLSWGEPVFGLMREADTLVLPSMSEGMPLVLIEAMSQSLPVIASAVGGNKNLIKDGKNGLLFSKGNIAELIKCLKAIAYDEKLREEIVANGLEVARENTVETTTGKVWKNTLQLLKQKSQ